jgi:hypothetical protein
MQGAGHASAVRDVVDERCRCPAPDAVAIRRSRLDRSKLDPETDPSVSALVADPAPD